MRTEGLPIINETTKPDQVPLWKCKKLWSKTGCLTRSNGLLRSK